MITNALKELPLKEVETIHEYHQLFPEDTL